MDRPRHQRPTRLNRLLFGACYYPEHWTEEDRRDDAERMRDAGMNVVRMAEFAWDRVEPARGKFDFSLFDETIARLGEVGIDTILCTPTAAPPRWLTEGHDDWLRVDHEDRRMVHGSRQHCCTTHEEFRAESVRVTRAMAEHYATNPHVIGWQTDNEFHCHFGDCYCPTCQAAFQRWLQDRYGTIKALNAAWGAAFWAQTYSRFEHVPPAYPKPRPAPPNPTHLLDYRRFVSDAVREFQRRQVKVLREANAAWWITHNGLFRPIDYWTFTEDLDFLGIDVYPAAVPHGPKNAYWAAFKNQLCRAAGGGYIVPEQQSGSGCHHYTPQPGQMRLWALQSLAHGADGLLHFRWRTCRFGAEEYWCGVLDHDNVPRRRYEELLREGREFQKLSGPIVGSTLDVRAAVLLQYEQDHAHDAMPLGLPGPVEQRKIAFGELWKRNLPAGLVHAEDSFAGLELLVLPSMRMIDEELAGKLEQFVRDGGVLVITARSATRDRNNQVLPVTPPGSLTKLTGATVEEFCRLKPEMDVRLRLGDNELSHGGGYEILAPTDAETIATWTAADSFGPCAAERKPAVTVNKAGKGKVIYIGTFLNEQNAAPLFDAIILYSNVTPLADAPEGVEITCRKKGKQRFLFVLNHNGSQATIQNLPQGTNLLTGETSDGFLTLDAYDVAVIECNGS
ncbi:MAG: beta-galactosidase [Phycisphaerae bacterium]|nr:beta-galactosidase [Phycisphaerae bacterium]